MHQHEWNDDHDCLENGIIESGGTITCATKTPDVTMKILNAGRLVNYLVQHGDYK